jgi:hypothetical protein
MEGEAMSNIYDLLKKAEDDKRAQSGDAPILEVGALETSKAIDLSSPIMGEILARAEGVYLPDGEDIPLSSSCLIEMAKDIKKALEAMVRSSLHGLEKANEAEGKRDSRMSVMKNYKKIDLILNIFQNYIRMSQPVAKKDTIHTILDELLAGYQKELEDKSILVSKDYHAQLLEITIHEEQLRFILGSILQYAILTTPMNGSLRVGTRPVLLQKSPEEEKIVPLKGRYSEVSVLCSFLEKPALDPGKKPGAPNPSQEEGFRSLLLVSRELVQKHQGNFEFKVDDVEMRRSIIMRFPAERRQSFYYKSARS